MSKLEKCNLFCDKLKAWRVNFDRHSDYHIQVQIQHNFYPSKGTYYNSVTGKKSFYPLFENVNEFQEFLRDNVQ